VNQFHDMRVRAGLITAMVVLALVVIGLFYWTKRTSTPVSAPSSPPPPAISMTTTSDKLAALPTYGNIDSIQLVEDGRVLTIRGWIAPPTVTASKSIDEIIVALDVPVKGAELTQEFRPDVVQGKGASSYFTGFTIRLPLLNPLQALPTSASLCVAGSSAGELIVRANDHQEMQCH
jgi:hypothetical protein